MEDFEPLFVYFVFLNEIFFIFFKEGFVVINFEAEERLYEIIKIITEESLHDSFRMNQY